MPETTDPILAAYNGASAPPAAASTGDADPILAAYHGVNAPVSALEAEDSDPIVTAYQTGREQKPSPPSEKDPILAAYHGADTTGEPSGSNASVLSRAWNWANSPVYEFNPNHQGGFVGGLEDVADSLATPLSIGLTVATLGSGALLRGLGVAVEELPVAVKVLRGLVTTGFTLQQAHGMVVSSSRALDAIRDGDTDRAKEYAVQAAAGLVGVALAAREMNERPIIPNENLGPLKSVEKTGTKEQLATIYKRENIFGKRDADVAAAEQQARETADALNRRFDALDKGDVDPGVLRGAIFRRLEFPGQQAIEDALNRAKASGKIGADTLAKYEAATKLTPEQIDFVRDLRAAFENNFHLAEENDIALQHLDDYVSHVWKKPEDVPGVAIFRENNKLGNFDTTVSSARHRVFLKALDGEAVGRELVADDPVGLAAWQELSLRKAIANRQALERIKSANVLMDDGRPMVTHSGYGKVVGDDSTKALLVDPKPSMDRTIPKKVLVQMGPDKLQKGLSDGTIESLPDITRADGTTITNRYAWSGAGYRAVDHPSFADWRYIAETSDGPVLMKSDVRVHPDAYDTIVKRLGIDQSAVRNSAVGRAALKLSTEAKGSVFAGYNPFHIIQTGLRSIMTGTNPFRVPDIDVVGDRALRVGVVHGLKFSSRHSALSDFTSDASLENEGITSQGTFANRLLPGSDKFHEFLWRYVNGQKAHAYIDLYRRYRSAYPEWTMDQVATKAADDTNNRFGLQNWGALGTSKSVQDAMRLGLLAPDWLTSEMRLGLSLFRSGSKILWQDVGRISAGMVLAARVGNMLVSGNPRWDQPFGIVLPGNSKRDDVVLSMRTLPGDVVHWMADWHGAAETRLSPGFTRPLLELITQRDRNGRRVLPENQITDYLTAIAPIPLQNVLQRQDVSMDDKEKLALGFTKLAASVYPARSEAEKLAQQYAYDRNKSGPVDPDDLPKHLRITALMDGMRTGKIPPAQAYQVVPAAEAKKLIADAKLTPLQGYVSRLPLGEMLDVYALATGKERQQIHPMLMRKRFAYLEKTPARFRADDPTFRKLREVGLY
ncbi:MAG TPA: hypothetical protein VHU83_06620 [Bryobacteraceae bacterium]|jgi:hypothetical protein|nr:hypothetical protein [Bryobacteraceae bacterium]